MSEGMSEERLAELEKANRGYLLATSETGELIAEVKRLRSRLAGIGRPTTEWGIQERPDVETTEYCGFSSESLREHASRTPLGRVMRRTAYRGPWEVAEETDRA